MTSKIFKYELSIVESQILKLPQGSRILSVVNQRDEIVLYALIFDDKKYTEDILIKVVGTGHDINFDIDTDGNHYEFLGTVSLYNGALMFHVFYMG